MEKGRARNIRDIAHLYISSARSREAAVPRVVVVGADRDCFPGFHVANLAAALACRGHAVRLVEESGLLANAAYFLALPPQVYAATSRRTTPSVCALQGIEVWFSPPPEATSASRAIELVHAPPLDTPSPLESCRDEDVIAFVARRPQDVPREFRAPRRARARPYLVAVGSDAEHAEFFQLAGVITRWEGALGDTLPAPTRDPKSKLSRDYIECAGRLVSGRDEEWKRHDHSAARNTAFHRPRRAVDR